MQAVVLAGGLGTRLRSRVENVPKSMAPIAGRPFLAWLLDRLQAEGVDRVTLSVGHRREIIMDAFGTRHGSIELSYAVEETPLGTGGALRKALDIADVGPVLVMNGDSFAQVSYRKMMQNHASSAHNAVTMALASMEDSSRYGAVGVHDGRVTQFLAAGAQGPSLINAGIYVVHKHLFEMWTGGDAFSFEKEFLAPFIDRLDVRPFPVDGWFLDIGTPDDYDRAQIELLAMFRAARS